MIWRFLLLLLLAPACLQAAPRPVVTEILHPVPVLPGTYIGVIEADTTLGVAFEVLGRLISREVSEGSLVTKGQVLAQLDATTFIEDRDAARAALEAAETSLGTIARTRDRMKTLVERGVASAASMETVERNYSVAEAQLETARATLARAEDGVARMTLTAPMEGLVLQTRYDPGTTVAAGDPVLVLASPKGRNAVVTLPSTLLRDPDPESDMRFKVYGSKLPPDGIKGRLLRIDPASASQTRMRTTRIALGPEAETLALGELVDVQIEEDRENHLLVPRAAIVTEGDQSFVWVVESPRRTLARRPVTLGPAEGSRVPVQGLEAGTEIMLRGLHGLSEGQEVGPALPLPPTTSRLQLGE